MGVRNLFACAAPPPPPLGHDPPRAARTELYTAGDAPRGRLGATQTMITERTVLMYGGFVKEAPYFLGDFWSALLPPTSEFQRPVEWTVVEPKLQLPKKKKPVTRYTHAAAYSEARARPARGTRGTARGGRAGADAARGAGHEGLLPRLRHREGCHGR